MKERCRREALKAERLGKCVSCARMCNLECRSLAGGYKLEGAMKPT